MSHSRRDADKEYNDRIPLEILSKDEDEDVRVNPSLMMKGCNTAIDCPLDLHSP